MVSPATGPPQQAAAGGSRPWIPPWAKTCLPRCKSNAPLRERRKRCNSTAELPMGRAEVSDDMGGKGCHRPAKIPKIDLISHLVGALGGLRPAGEVTQCRGIVTGSIIER
jgi:hypothetical protein